MIGDDIGWFNIGAYHQGINVRQQPYGWPGEKVTTDMPTNVDVRQGPFERTPSTCGENLNNLGGGYMNYFYAREFWRFVMVQQEAKVNWLVAARTHRNHWDIQRNGALQYADSGESRDSADSVRVTAVTS